MFSATSSPFTTTQHCPASPIGPRGGSRGAYGGLFPRCWTTSTAGCTLTTQHPRCSVEDRVPAVGTRSNDGGKVTYEALHLTEGAFRFGAPYRQSSGPGR